MLGCERRCPGCRHRDLERDVSELKKWHWVRAELLPWQGLVEPISGPSERWGYRRKTCLHAAWDGSGWKFGLLTRKQGIVGRKAYEVVHIPDCPIHSAGIRELVRGLSQALPPAEEFPLIFLAVSGELATLVFKSRVLPRVPMLDWAALGLGGLFANLNPSAGKRVYAQQGWVHLWGRTYGEESGFSYGPDSFQQLIPGLHELVLDALAEFFRSSEMPVGILDLYSGIGRSLKLWGDLGYPSIGVELSSSAVESAHRNIGAGRCLRGRVSDRLPQLEDWMREQAVSQCFAYVNPPRLGLEAKVVSWMAKQKLVKRVAYLSCNPRSLFQDLSTLCGSGYEVKRIIPYDFFPQTDHVETLVLLDRQ